MAVDHNNPQSRNEEILIATIDGNEYNKAPQSRMEELLLELKETIEEGGGGGGTSDYENLSNQPQVNGETLIGDKTGADLGLVDAEEGKGLSTNDYDDNEKAAVAAATSAISAMKDGTDLDSFGDVEVALLDKADTSDLGTAASKNSTNAVTSGSTDLVESGAVKDAIDSAVSRAYHHAGTKTVAQLTHDLLIALNEGNVYEMTDSGTTTSDFMEGIGRPIKEGDNVGIARASEGVYKFDLLSGFVDTTNFVQKSQTAGLLKNDGTVNDEIEGDVDQLKSGLTDLSDHVDGDATTYPYADVITVSDAVPANLADCSVKIEPVQDLHGYDKPWVGGAGTNKLPINNDVATQSDSGITWFMDNGSMSIDGTASSTVRNESGNYALAVASYVIKGTEYFKLFCGGGNFSGALGLRLYFTDNTYIEAIRTRAQDTVIIKSLSTHVGKTVKGIGYYINSGCVFDHNTYSMAIVENEDDTWTPYENICPISGHTEAVMTRDGKNLAENNLDTSSALAGVTITKNPDGSMDCNGTITNTGYTRLFNDNLNLQVGQTYTISGMASTMGMRLYFLDKDQTEISRINCYGTPVTFEVPQNTVTTRANIITGSKDSVVDVTVYPQVELGSSASDFEPYQGKTYTLALGDTIYGGTVDFDSGVMTVDRGYAEFDGSNDEGWSIAGSGLSAVTKILANVVKKVGIGIANIIADKYISKNTTDVYDGAEGIAVDGNGWIRVASLEYTESISSWTTYLASNPLQVCYELATPITIRLTPTQIQLLQGQNTLYASTGDISVTVNGVSGAIGAVQEQANATDNALAQLAADIAEQLPDAPTTDGTYVLTVTVADGAATYSWESAT